jgi:serine/threonine protein phosphatase PrpC
MYVLSLPKQIASNLQRDPEDAYFYDARKAIYAVADGVTRDRDAKGNYPNPSPAKLASDAFCNTVAHTTIASDTDMYEAFARANKRIQELNIELGFIDNVDYLAKDYAGTVAAIVHRTSERIIWGYIGDCGVAIVNREMGMIFCTEDAVNKVRPFFASDPSMTVDEKKISIRRDYRNNPNADHPTYGVLTGEQSALNYVQTGEQKINKDDIVLIFSDGARALIESPEMMRTLISSVDRFEQKVTELRKHTDTHADEITLLVVS